MSALLDTLEKNYGAGLLWAWTREWLELENECADDEHIPLEEYLCLRAENDDEVRAT